MLTASRLRSHLGRLRINNDGIALGIIRFLIFGFLGVFGTLSILGSFNRPSELPSESPVDYNLENLENLEYLAVKNVTCSFYISDYYAKTPRYICYLLLVFTIVIRNHQWLAVGAAASVLTYSGVAAIHLIILSISIRSTSCESRLISSSSASFVDQLDACVKVIDPDFNLSVAITTSVMMGVLPVISWSKTFRRSTSKAILLLWFSLLAIGNLINFADTLTGAEPSGKQFQICPKDDIEHLPKVKFQAPFLNQTWRDSFSAFIRTPQQYSRSPRNSSSPACFYSCFATTAYLGRKDQNIVVWDSVLVPNPVFKNDAAFLYGCTLFLTYTFIALLTLCTTSSEGLLTKGLRKISIEYSRQPGSSRWKGNIAIKRTRASVTTDSSEATTLVKKHVTMLKVVQFFTQLISFGAFCGNIIFQEMQNSQAWEDLTQEPFAAVGQWSNLAVVLLVLVAAWLGRILSGEGERRPEEGFELDDRRDGEDEEDWDWRVGYAS